jgi:hypothetical protein
MPLSTSLERRSRDSRSNSNADRDDQQSERIWKHGFTVHAPTASAEGPPSPLPRCVIMVAGRSRPSRAVGAVRIEGWHGYLLSAITWLAARTFCSCPGSIPSREAEASPKGSTASLGASWVACYRRNGRSIFNTEGSRLRRCNVQEERQKRR